MSKAERYPVLHEFIEVIDEWLENDRREPRKQRHTVTRIFKRLQEERGFRGATRASSGWMQVFKSENQECLLEGLKRISATWQGGASKNRL